MANGSYFRFDDDNKIKYGHPHNVISLEYLMVIHDQWEHNKWNYVCLVLDLNQKIFRDNALLIRLWRDHIVFRGKRFCPSVEFRYCVSGASV